MAEILKLIITNFKSIDNRLKSVEVIRPIAHATLKHVITVNCVITITYCHFMLNELLMFVSSGKLFYNLIGNTDCYDWCDNIHVPIITL